MRKICTGLDKFVYVVMIRYHNDTMCIYRRTVGYSGTLWVLDSENEYNHVYSLQNVTFYARQLEIAFCQWTERVL